MVDMKISPTRLVSTPSAPVVGTDVGRVSR